jgi:hypothetical protein
MEQVQQILQGLDDKYLAFKTLVNNEINNVSGKDLDTILTKLRNHERGTLNIDDSEEGNGKALFTRQKGEKPRENKGNACACCGKHGHDKSKCRHKDKACNYCNAKGHQSYICNKKKNGSNNNKLDRKNWGNGEYENSSEQESGNSAAQLSSYCFVASKSLRDPNTWILDSGATSSITWNRDVFISYMPQTGNSTIQCPDGSAHSIAGKGDIQIHCKQGAEIKELVFSDVLHLPSFHQLLSEVKAVQKGLEVWKKGTTCQVELELKSS